MDYSVCQLFSLFLIYSFLGWCVEVSFVAVTLGEVVNRGFLNGPVCPIYGFGMLGVLLLLEPVSGNLLLLFLGGMLLCSAVELLGGWILEKVFHTRWWDYSDKPLNLHGYICLSFSILWGLAVVFAVRLVHPFIMKLLGLLPQTLLIVLLVIFYGLLVTDLIVTLVTIAGLKKRAAELEKVAGALHTVGDAISTRLGTTALAADAKLDELKETGQEKMAGQKERVAAAVESGQKKLSEAVEQSQQKWSEAKEQSQQKWSEAKEQSQQKWSEVREQRLQKREAGRPGPGDTLDELLALRDKLEAERDRLLADYRSHIKFGARRLGKAFPDVRRAMQERLDLWKRK